MWLFLYTQNMKLGLHTISFWFGLVMVLVVSALGISMLTTDALSDRLNGPKRTFFIVLMFSYAAYRGYRLYQSYKQQKRNED